jgi:hypothetical protein
MSTSKDLRRAPRYDYECSVMVLLGDTGYFSIMENISEMGCCIHRPNGWTQQRGVPVKLFMNLGRLAPAVSATTIWSSEGFIGFEYGVPQPLPPELLSITVGEQKL